MKARGGALALVALGGVALLALAAGEEAPAAAPVGDPVRAAAAAAGAASGPAPSPTELALGRNLTATAGDYRRAGYAIPENPYLASPASSAPVRVDAGGAYMPGVRYSDGAPVPWQSRAGLPDDALVFWNDRYSQASAHVPGIGGLPGATVDEFGRNVSGANGFSIDQLGKAFGAAGDGLAQLAGSIKGIIRSVTDSPLWQIAMTGAAFVPGIGTAVSMGMAAAYAYGHDLSLRDAALATARAAVPGGAAGQAAFDVAVALASGQSATDAAIGAARAQLPPGVSREAFDAGIDAAKGKSIPQSLQDHAANAAAAYLDGGTS